LLSEDGGDFMSRKMTVAARNTVKAVLDTFTFKNCFHRQASNYKEQTA
jgi:hypothetical protein